MIEQLDALGVLMGKARQAVSGVIFGQDAVVDQTLITLLSGGHVLLTVFVVLGIPSKTNPAYLHNSSDLCFFERRTRCFVA